MSIESEARAEAERRWPSPNSGLYEGLIIGFRLGAVWASEQADREPSDAEVLAAKEVLDSVEYADEPQAIRAALLAAQEVRRGD